jgi:hypothetical protein
MVSLTVLLLPILDHLKTSAGYIECELFKHSKHSKQEPANRWDYSQKPIDWEMIFKSTPLYNHRLNIEYFLPPAEIPLASKLIGQICKLLDDNIISKESIRSLYIMFKDDGSIWLDYIPFSEPYAKEGKDGENHFAVINKEYILCGSMIPEGVTTGAAHWPHKTERPTSDKKMLSFLDAVIKEKIPENPIPQTIDYDRVTPDEVDDLSSSDRHYWTSYFNEPYPIWTNRHPSSPAKETLLPQ